MSSAINRATVDLLSSCVTLAERTTRFSRCLQIRSNAYLVSISQFYQVITYAVAVLIDKLYNLYVVTQGLYNRRKQHAFGVFTALFIITEKTTSCPKDSFSLIVFSVLLLLLSSDFPEISTVKTTSSRFGI